MSRVVGSHVVVGRQIWQVAHSREGPNFAFELGSLNTANGPLLGLLQLEGFSLVRRVCT